MPTPNFSGGVVIVGSRVLLPVDIATIEPNVIFPVSGTVDIGNASLNIGTVQLILDVATINTITGTVDISGTVEVSTIQSPVGISTVASPVLISSIQNAPIITSQNNFEQINILTGGTVSSSGSTVISLKQFQNMVLDIVYGTVLVGSIQTSIYGLEPQSGIITSTLAQGAWYAGTVVTGQRLVPAHPLGTEVSVSWVTTGTVQQVYITSELST